MEFLNRSYVQARDLFLSMTPAARVTAGLLIVVVAVSFAFLFRQGATGPDAFLYGGERLSRSQLNRIETAFGQAGLNDFDFESYRVRVPRGQEAKYLAAIADAGATPADFHRLLEIALTAGGVFGSKEEKRQQLKAAREQQLSMIVSEMRGIEQAYVMYNEADERIGRSPGMKDRVVTASVNVQAVSDDALDARGVKMIRRLVASAIGGKAANVTVANLAGGNVYGGGDLEYDATEDPYYQRRFLFEAQTREKILAALGEIPRLLVAVSTEIDPKSVEESRQITVDPKTATVRQSSRDEETISDNTTPGGLVGAGANSALGPGGSDTAGQTAGRSNKNTSKLTEEESDSVPGHTETTSTTVGLIPTRITASIRIPSDHWKKVWQDKNRPADGSDLPKPTPEELKQFADLENGAIQDSIVSLLSGKETGENKFAWVNVSTYHSSPPEPIKGPSAMTSALAWTNQNWTKLGMMFLVAFGLVMLRSVVRSVPTGDPAAASGPTLHLETDEEEDGEDESDRPKLKLRKGISLKDDLADIVREDPDTAASILRSWIGNAS